MSKPCIWGGKANGHSRGCEGREDACVAQGTKKGRRRVEHEASLCLCGALLLTSSRGGTAREHTEPAQGRSGTWTSFPASGRPRDQPPSDHEPWGSVLLLWSCALESQMPAIRDRSCSKGARKDERDHLLDQRTCSLAECGQRSISEPFCRRLKNGPKPTRVLVSGTCDRVPYVAERLC